jgi:hypothetical protein
MRRLQAVATTITALALGTIASPIPVLASGCEAEAASIAAHIFDMSDADADGHLSLDEFANAGLERYGMSFDDYDANSDGQASVDEYFDLFDAHHPPADAI